MYKLYLFLLAGVICVSLFAGIIVAPCIFYPTNQELLNLSKFQSGLIMSGIFIKYAYVLIAISVFSLFFEIFNKCSFKLKIFRIILSLLILIAALIFNFYYNASIINMQKMGEIVTNSTEFIKIHKESELCFKIIVIMQLCLFFTKIRSSK